MEPVYRYFAALYGSRVVTTYVKECRTVVSKMTGNAYFPTTTPLLTLVSTHLDALEAAELAAHNGPKGSAAVRNDALLVVRGDMRQLKAGVQSAADADVTHAQTIIESAGMYVAKRAVTAKQVLAARYGSVPGEVNLDAKAFKGQGSYQWQMSLDGKTWSGLPGTVKASTVVSGLTAATIYYFQVRTLTAAGLSAWSTIVSIIAH
jgi:hypothetical protein